MSVVTEMKTTAEFDTWINANAALVLAYAEENDVAIRDLPISAREFRLDQLFYNDQNDRIATWITQYKNDTGNVSFSELSQEEYNKIIELQENG